MISVTDKALNQLREFKIAQQQETPIDGKEWHLRITAIPGGCSGIQYRMNFESEIHDDDTVITLDGLKILIEQTSAPVLKGAKLDYIEGDGRAGFIFENPNIKKSSCGGCCGGGSSSGGCGS